MIAINCVRMGDPVDRPYSGIMDVESLHSNLRTVEQMRVENLILLFQVPSLRSQIYGCGMKE